MLLIIDMFCQFLVDNGSILSLPVSTAKTSCTTNILTQFLIEIIIQVLQLMVFLTPSLIGLINVSQINSIDSQSLGSNSVNL